MESTAAAEPSTAVTPAADALRWRRIRRWAAWAYLGLLVALVALVGVPTDRGSLLLIILAGLGIR